MKQKSTSELSRGLMSEANLDSYLVRNASAFSDQSVACLLEGLYQRAGMSKAALARQAGMSEVYLHQVFSGRRRPSRDRLLCLCISMKATMEETQEVLKGAAVAPLYPRPAAAHPVDRAAFLADLAQALYGARLTAYAQGTDLLSAASEQWGWGLDWGGIALLWRAGCILRSPLLEKIAAARQRGAGQLILDPVFAWALGEVLPAWRRIGAAALSLGIPAPALTAGLSWLDGCGTAVLPANLLQAQRDCFGAHTYRRIDRPETEAFHTQWTQEA